MHQCIRNIYWTDNIMWVGKHLLLIESRLKEINYNQHYVQHYLKYLLLLSLSFPTPFQVSLPSFRNHNSFFVSRHSGFCNMHKRFKGNNKTLDSNPSWKHLLTLPTFNISTLRGWHNASVFFIALRVKKIILLKM